MDIVDAFGLLIIQTN